MVEVVGHRGASAAHPPGNTVEAFAAAAALGATWVELDVRPTRDGHLAVHHDAELPDGRPVHGTARADLPTWVPDLAQALDACAGLGVNVELKADGDPALHSRMVDGVIAVLEARRGARLLVSSFEWSLLDEVRRAAPALATGLLVVDPSTWLEPVRAASAGGHGSVNVFHGSIDRDLVERAHAAGIEVQAWTVDDPDRMVELVGLGVDALITNVPDVARTVLSGAPGLSGG